MLQDEEENIQHYGDLVMIHSDAVMQDSESDYEVPDDVTTNTNYNNTASFLMTYGYFFSPITKLVILMMKFSSIKSDILKINLE